MRTNRWLFSLACMLSVFVCGNAQKTPSPFQRGDRVVFLGNSITEGGHYHSYIWLYYITHFPDMRMRMYSAGTGGDSSWDMLERIEEDVYGKNPTVVTATFGMNDSGYFEYNGDNPTAFVERQMYRVDTTFQAMQKIMKSHKDTRVIMIAGTPYDETWQNEKNKPFLGKPPTSTTSAFSFVTCSPLSTGWVIRTISVFPLVCRAMVGRATKAMTAAKTRDKIPKINRLLSFISTFSCHKNSSASVAIEQPQARKGKNGMAMGWRGRESLRNRRTIGMAKTAATKKTRAIPEGP